MSVVLQKNIKAGLALFAVTHNHHAGAHPPGTQPILNVKVPLAGLVGMSAALLALGAMVSHGFDQAGIGLAGELTWRFASFVFFAAAIAGPVSRLLPFTIFRPLNALRRQLIWSFCAGYGVFLATLLLPNGLGGVTHDDATSGMILFVLFGGSAMAVMAYAASREAKARFGEKARRALLCVAASFFWLTYALTGLAHISGPHRPDVYYGTSLSLMILALLLRFADRFVAKFRGTLAVPAL
ncbi:MAG TPA: hypothetical protein VG501_05870 [Rhizomicrobium sp.]|nr:hypothetical protein [Rhizomicrobium sp.]